MNFSEILFLLCLVFGVYGKEKSMNSSSGELSSNTADVYRIDVGDGKRIVVEITSLRLGRRDSLAIRESRNEDGYLYKKVGRDIHKIMENDRSRSDPVTLPIILDTKWQTLYVKLRGKEKRNRVRFMARYISYPEEGQCRKSELEPTYDDDATMTCDSDEINPVGTRCDVTLKCGKKYQQYSTTMSCAENESGEWNWSGLIHCQPKRNLVDRCSYNFDDFTVNEGCPFSGSEVAQYLLEVEGVSGFDESYSRSTGRVVQCGNTCSHNAHGAWTVNCDGRVNRATYFRCLVCRVVYKCGRNVVIF